MSAWLSELNAGKAAIAVGVLVLLLLWETIAPFFPYFQHRLRERTRHGARNLILGTINGALTALSAV
ncbi:MAG: hypothetical protein ACYDH9_12885 [Limisphaerales bacterium]